MPQKYSVALCLVLGPALNRTVKEFAVELSLCMSILHWNSQIHVNESQGWSNLTSFHHCVELHFSDAQGCQALKRGPRFHSVVTNLSHWVASKVAVHDDAVSAESNLSWGKDESMQADLFRVACSLFRIGLFRPSDTKLSCSFSRGVLTVLVFALHPDSLMMSGACLKSG